jgi:hypothetical protein
MKQFLQRNWKGILPIILAFAVMIGFSAFHAYQISYVCVRNSAPPPFYGIRFTLYPNNYIDGLHRLGFKPGWVVIYAPDDKIYGKAFDVSLFGALRGSGTPRIVTKQLQQGREEIGKFQKAFAKLDAAVKTGMLFSDAGALLGRPVSILTNNDGTLKLDFIYVPHIKGYGGGDWLTNGITLDVSNGIILGKGYIYTAN